MENKCLQCVMSKNCCCLHFKVRVLFYCDRASFCNVNAASTKSADNRLMRENNYLMEYKDE